MVFDQFLNPLDVTTPKAMTAFDSDRIEPELRFAGIPLNVNVCGFTAIPGVEEESEGSASQHGWHAVMLSSCHSRDKLYQLGSPSAVSEDLGRLAPATRCFWHSQGLHHGQKNLLSMRFKHTAPVVHATTGAVQQFGGSLDTRGDVNQTGCPANG